MPDLPQRHAKPKPKANGVTKHEVEDKAWGNGRGGRPWRRKRERILKRDGYMCQCPECKGMKRIATEVDHIIPLSQDGTDDDSNLMAIAGYPCHARKTARESAASRK
ncbi:HNH endonuclease [Pseudomonas aeruginosa]|uniref:HNH endonuclease n=1 Tax=Pseudomonas aeruginosa TaxID=287 RepID=UPI000BB8E299|nr:HNH endonuclease [Pseudomonas aeruginosa]PCB15204.1 HNH endonuclease [Pseudomonas aeruginosa]